jgi:hypothetical protein
MKNSTAELTLSKKNENIFKHLKTVAVVISINYDATQKNFQMILRAIISVIKS